MCTRLCTTLTSLVPRFFVLQCDTQTEVEEWLLNANRRTNSGEGPEMGELTMRLNINKAYIYDDTASCYDIALICIDIVNSNN